MLNLFLKSGFFWKISIQKNRNVNFVRKNHTRMTKIISNKGAAIGKLQTFFMTEKKKAYE